MTTVIQPTNMSYQIQQPQFVAVQQTDNSRGIKVPIVRGLAITQIIFGATTICFGIGAIAGLNYGYWVNSSGSGIWFGLWILITGIIGISSSQEPTNKCLNGTNMGFNIVCTFFSFSVGGYFVMAVVFYANCPKIEDWSFDNYYLRSYYRENPLCSEDQDAGMVIYSILFIIMLAEFIISLMAAVYCCNGGCCGTASSGVIIQQQPQHTTFVTTSTTGVVNTSQNPTSHATSYPGQNIQVAALYANTAHNPQSGAYPQQSGSYPQQQFIATNAPMGMSKTNITYPAQQHGLTETAPPPPYV